MKPNGRPVSFLASVTCEREAVVCAGLGADIIDAKNPAAGALGALSHDIVRAIRAAVPADVPVSATIGDPVEEAADAADRVRCMAATGVDIVKVGLGAGAVSQRLLDRLRRSPIGETRLVAVLLADRGIDLDLVARTKDAGFAGVMLDTADKASGPLPDIVAADLLQAFVAAARRAGLFAGFAGSLRACHVAGLVAFGPDILGFRGGLCPDYERAEAIDREAVRAVRRAIDAASADAACGRPRTDGIARRQPERAL